MNKGLFAVLLVVSLLALAAGVLVAHFLIEPDRLYETAGGELSFKPFTLQQLLNNEVEIDLKNCGKKLDSPELDGLVERVSKLRGLSVEKPIEFRSCSDVVIIAQMMQFFTEELPEDELEADEKLLVALGLIPPDENLEETLTKVYTEQLAGSYDPETKAITIVKSEDAGETMDELTLAHEVTHALQDQHFKLEDPPLENEDYNGDNDISITSLVEGDATETMILYAGEYIEEEELLRMMTESAEVPSEELEKAPLYIQKSLLFPYEQGLSFASAVMGTTGFVPLDRAYRNPPMSSEQIIHPEKYIDGVAGPRDVPLSDISDELGSGWKLINSDCMGEFDVSVWIEEYSGAASAKDASEGWGGNTIQYYQGPDKKYVVVNDFVWDSPEDANEFFLAYKALLLDRFGNRIKKVGGGENWYLLNAKGELFYCGMADDATLCLQAPDRETLGRVLDNLEGFPAVEASGPSANKSVPVNNRSLPGTLRLCRAKDGESRPGPASVQYRNPVRFGFVPDDVSPETVTRLSR